MLRAIAGAVLVVMALTLQGCGGCDQAALTTCAQSYTSDPSISAGTDAVCPTWQTYTGCVKDAGCCDFEITSDAWKKRRPGLVSKRVLKNHMAEEKVSLL